MSSFTDALDVEFIDGHNWRVTQEFTYAVGTEDSKCFIRVPKGFVTDFASVPRGLWNLFPPTGSYGMAAVVHDYLYRGGYITDVSTPGIEKHITPTRAQADGILREAMGVSKVGAFTRWTVWAAVRVGGRSPWSKGHDVS